MQCHTIWQLVCYFFFAVYSLSFSKVVYASWHYENSQAMGTEINVILWHEDADKARFAINAVFAEMRRVDTTLSPYIESSDLSYINQNAFSSPQKLTPEFSFLLDKSLYFSKITKGAFDITFASVGWYYDYREKKRPEDQQIKQLLPAVNYKLLEFDKLNSLLGFGHKNLRIDLGGIAKGHAVDRAISILQKNHIKHASVSAGGDSKIIGNRDGRPWVVGIKNPRFQGDDKNSVIRLPLIDTAISTSGDYERFFIDQNSGERIHHIINPKTGKSAKGIVSVTVLGPRGVDTDALSTSVFVLGVEKGLNLINTIPGFDAIIIDSRGKVHYSEELMPAN